MRTVVLIPARYASTRFPGKPVTPLLGKPMILWVAEAAARTLGKENIFVATDDDRIRTVVEGGGFQAVMTPSELLTGTDRIAYAAKSIPADVYLNIQGDEPMLDAASIRAVVNMKLRYPKEVINAMAEISAEEDPASVHLPKVVTNEAGRMLYMSRLPIPGSKKGISDGRVRHKQVCIYAFSASELAAFLAFGRKGTVESIEDIEILRFLETDIPVRMCPVAAGSLAVDIPEDVARVEAALRKIHAI